MAKVQYFIVMLSLVIIFVSSLTISAVSDEEEIKEVIPVDSVSLERYAGVWYEIAKIPNRFQK